MLVARFRSLLALTLLQQAVVAKQVPFVVQGDAPAPLLDLATSWTSIPTSQHPIAHAANVFFPPLLTSGGAGCRGEPLAPGWHNVTLTVRDSASDDPSCTLERTHTIRIPPAYDGVQPLPTLFGFHGSHGNPQKFLDPPVGTGSHLDQLADRESFVLILPTGSLEFYNETIYQDTGEQVHIGYGWNIPYVPPVTLNVFDKPAQDDIAYVLEILNHTQQTLCVDATRSYATGQSGGGRMSSALACDPEASNHFAAVAPFSGLRAGPAEFSSDPALNLTVPVTKGYQACRPSRPVAIVASHGGADTTNPYDGNTNPQWGYGIDVALATWRTLLGCADQPVIETPMAGSEPAVVRRSTSWCGRAAVVQFYIADHEHPWPSDVKGWDAGQALWDVLTRFTL